ncbi:hypothetical protein NA56DRAFT_744819 [Hyaloscypha hepaticicola]|uniref:Uncharacterized protein n=1 Tax=Hyaloscypha hepaticicola TaxID=2082293 RepID=A0A2J6QHR3_9HELO|nr:hypothetical protein NA56DRAFT_744819 [Hyaloscypha hepaticicola]
MALHQTVDAETLAWYYKHAQRQYPDDDFETALNKWIKEEKEPGLFFLNEAEERCIWGADLVYFDHWGTGPGYYKYPVGDRLFFIPKYKETLKQIDRPKTEGVLFRHPSEKGWSLPETYKRHFLKFPIEIQDQILNKVLTEAPPKSLQPSVISCNWVTCWNKPHLASGTSFDHIRPSTQDKPTQLAWIPRRDKYGAYSHVFQAAIDATVLRTCKHFYHTGINMLYSKNTLSFYMPDRAWKASPPTLPPGQLDVLFRPEPGYLFYDPFLRFIYFIGPKNSVRIKSLEFNGFVKRHSCSSKYCNKPSVEKFIPSICFYIPFIKRFCIGLEKLVLHAEEDSLVCEEGPVAPQDVVPATHAEAMIPLLENEIRTISTLKELEIRGSNDLSFAEPTITWLQERYARRIREALKREEEEKDLAEVVRSANIHCGFCGEGHVWAECHNLCNFCGGYEHFRKSCPRRKL